MDVSLCPSGKTSTLRGFRAQNESLRLVKLVCVVRKTEHVITF
jgi:hypothetical protein